MVKGQFGSMTSAMSGRNTVIPDSTDSLYFFLNGSHDDRQI